MTNNRSCALFRVANLEALDYPFDAALASAMAICDEAVVVVGQSQDNTLAWICDLAADYGARVKIVRDTIRFDLGWQERWWNLASSHTDADWLLWLDADEVIDPNHAGYLRNLMAMPTSPKLIRFPFVHFYATKSYHIDFPLRQNTRLGRRSAGFRMVNDRSEHNPKGAACHVVVRDPRIDIEVSAHNRIAPMLYETPFPILHYGWCRNPVALSISQRKQHAWYADGDGLEDGRLPAIVDLWDFELGRHIEKGDVHRWKSVDHSHPAIMRRWFERHKWQWGNLERELQMEMEIFPSGLAAECHQ